MDKLAKTLKIKDQADWHGVKWKIIKQHGGESLLGEYRGSITSLLASVYPEYQEVPLECE